MARRIHVLPDALVDQIAAGEVVERPASIVKELVENALDAAATRIEIVVRNGGKTEIRVADDGCGMSRDDALVALDRHATSKISTPDDLRGVRTFGFRGEALPSIAAVTRFTIETAEPGEVGTRVRAASGRIAGVEDAARQAGTTVVARSLFHGLPVRAKFLKTAAVETRAIVDAVTSLALANLSTAFRLESNGRELFDLPAAPDLLNRVADLWGPETAGRFIPLSSVRGGTRVAGLVDRPDAAETGPRRIHLFVGGRPFRDRGLVHAAERGYRTTVPRQARPSLLLYIDVQPGDVDVNVHPSKAEVKFRERAAVEEVVEEAVRNALGTLGSAAPLERRPGVPRLVGPGAGHEASRPPAAGAASRGQFSLFVSAARARPGGASGADGEPMAGEQASEDASAADADAAGEPGGDVAPRAARPHLWQVHDSYIFAETRSGLVIIDQHSAHERVLFEAMMRQFSEGGAVSQRLLFPITLRFGPAEYDVFEQSAEIFARAGFELEPFGGRTVIVHAVPSPHPWFEPERCLREMIGELAEGSDLTRAAKNQFERIASTFACKAAIKAGQHLGPKEMLELFDGLFATELPYHDVHGRPTVIRLSLQELERRFGRSG